MAETAADPYADYKDKEIASDKLDLLANLAEGWKHAQEDVEKLATQLNIAQNRVKEIEEKEIPEIMDELEIETMNVAGVTIGVTEKVRCSIPKAKQFAAFNWLRENGHEKLIKRKISVQFAMGEEDDAQAFRDLNLKAQPDIELDDVETIANPTLVKFVKEKTEAGEDLPTDLFPVFRQRVAKIK